MADCVLWRIQTTDEAAVTVSSRIIHFWGIDLPQATEGEALGPQVWLPPKEL